MCFAALLTHGRKNTEELVIRLFEFGWRHVKLMLKLTWRKTLWKDFCTFFSYYMDWSCQLAFNVNKTS